jgi:hypothetical protein
MARRLIGHREAVAFVGMGVRKIIILMNAPIVRKRGALFLLRKFAAHGLAPDHAASSWTRIVPTVRPDVIGIDDKPNARP